MYKKSNALYFFVLILILLGLVGALIPLSDLDLDGCLESLATAGFLSPSILSFSIGLLALFTRICTHHLLASQSFFAPSIPPPISTK